MLAEPYIKKLNQWKEEILEKPSANAHRMAALVTLSKILSSSDRNFDVHRAVILAVVEAARLQKDMGGSHE
jgi:hypothetical protein